VSQPRSTSIQYLSKGICFYEVLLWPLACSQAIVFNGGVSVTKPLIALCLGVTTVLFAQDKSTLSPPEATQRRPGEFENQFLAIQIVPGWTVATSTGQTLTLVKGKYLLSINPIFLHASGVIGGRFGEIASGKKSIDAVMHNVDQRAGGFECSEWPPEALVATKAIALGNLYTDSSKPGNGCTLPSSRGPVWFGSYFSGQGSETDYAITLSYDTNDVNALPKKGAPELTLVFRQVAQMLKTLQLKPPMIISKVDPDSALPGATLTIYGSGFNLFNEASSAVQFSDFPNNPMSAPVVAADGKSLTFQVPTSINTVSCDAGQIDVGEFCVPIPANHVDINDCLPLPDGSTNWCGVPIPPAAYQISVTVPGWGVSSNPVSFTVIAPKPGPVSILLLYPNYGVSVGDTITVRGSGFTPTENTVQIGSAVVENLSSPDGHMITFQAPAAAGLSFVHGIKIYSATVTNANGQSNSISFAYR